MRSATSGQPGPHWSSPSSFRSNHRCSERSHVIHVATLGAMRGRGVVAAVAGMVGAATAHVLDTAGLLPGVHETVDVRNAMGPGLTVTWLAMAAGLAWFAARTRPLPVGAGAALLVSAVPELVGRHDPGAVGEPGAVAGALLQWLLLMAVLALLLLADRRLIVAPVPSYPVPVWPAHRDVVDAYVTKHVDRRGRPRAPPVTSSRPLGSLREEGNDRTSPRAHRRGDPARPAARCSRRMRWQLERRRGAGRRRIDECGVPEQHQRDRVDPASQRCAHTGRRKQRIRLLPAGRDQGVVLRDRRFTE